MPVFFVWLHQLIFVIVPSVFALVFRLLIGGGLFVSVYLLFKTTILPALESVSQSLLLNLGAIEGLGNSLYEIIQILEIYKLLGALISCIFACFWIKLSVLANRAYATLRSSK